MPLLAPTDESTTIQRTAGWIVSVFTNQRAGIVWACVAFLAVDTFSSSFTHVHDLAARHHQTGWFAWASAVGVEMLPITSWLIRQYRAHTDQPTSWLPYLALGSGVVMSLGANLAQAHPKGGWDVVFACWPAYVFAIVMVMAETSLGHRAETPAMPEEASQSVTGGKMTDDGPPVVIDRGDRDAPSRHKRPARRDGRVGRAEYIARLKAQLQEDPTYQIDYAKEMTVTTYSRSWLEKAWADARREAPASPPVRVVA